MIGWQVSLLILEYWFLCWMFWFFLLMIIIILYVILDLNDMERVKLFIEGNFIVKYGYKMGGGIKFFYNKRKRILSMKN